jgi:hypothetical protein
MAFNPNIVPGIPPLLWSDVHDAFVKVNENFDILLATVGGGSGLTPIDFETLDTNLKPTSTNTYGIGDSTYKWKNIYVEEYSTIPGNEFNGVWLGSAHLQGIGTTINLPANSTVDGNLLIDPDKTFFKTITVDSGNSVVATEFGSDVNFESGTGISLAVDSASETITVENSGVTQLIAGTAISVSSATGNITVTNTGVTSVGNTTSLPASATGRAAGTGITASATSGGVTFTNTGVVSITQGSGITVSNDPATGDVTITNSSPAQVTFRTFAVTGTIGQASIVADDLADTFTFNAGYGINLNTNDATDTLTVAVDQNIDIIGSVFADDSTLLVDGVDAKIKGTVDTLNVTASSILSGAGTGIINNFVTATIGTVNGNLVGNVTGNTTGYHTGDVTGSVFADNSTKLVDAVEGLIVGEVDTNTVTTENGVFIKNTDYSLFSDEGGDFYIRGSSTDGDIIIRTNASGLGQYDFTFGKDGNLTIDGSVTAIAYGGDLTGSVFGDDSNKLVDAVEGKIVGDIDVAGTAAFNVSNVPSDSTGASGDKQGMIAFDATSVYFCIADWAAPGTADIWVKQDWGTTGAW